MSHDTTIKQIQELVPSVMELSFGCEMENNGKKFLIYKEATDGYFMAIALDKNYSTILVSKLNNQLTNTVILGKPITLAVVLRAIEVKYKGDLFASVASNGWFHFGRERGFWKMDKDNFNDQSDETRTFIGELLN